MWVPFDWPREQMRLGSLLAIRGRLKNQSGFVIQPIKGEGQQVGIGAGAGHQMPSRALGRTLGRMAKIWR